MKMTDVTTELGALGTSQKKLEKTLGKVDIRGNIQTMASERSLEATTSK